MLRTSVNENKRIALRWAPERRRTRGRPKEAWQRKVERERGELGFKGWAKTERLGERERKALFPSEGKGQDDDDYKLPFVGPFSTYAQHRIKR